MDELVDNQGRNFLHVAVRNNSLKVVKNTPLHLAISSPNQNIARLLLENRSVHLSVKNQNGETPLNLAISQIEYGLISIQNPHIWILYCLWHIGAICGPERLDLLICNAITVPTLEDELKKYESTTGNLIIVSALIATVTFAAAFTMPGLHYGYDLAYVCGSCAIRPSRRIELIMRCEEFVYVAGQSMMAAFALSVYLVLAPVNIFIGLVVCIFAFPSVLLSNPDNWQRFRLIVTIKSRLGWSGMCKAA
uniref:PGG domain-containing protein n=1 Tax=Ananas comosus var. bracteatus TaxID=296719 RepID=A0A6V7PJR7_ANACO|nr:unnamed protein product [Ananas comosus var. bracteatus]